METTVMTLKGIPKEARDNFKAWCAERGLNMKEELLRYMIEKAEERSKQSMGKYRTDEYGSVYEYDADSQGYIFIGKLNGQSLSEWLIDYDQEA